MNPELSKACEVSITILVFTKDDLILTGLVVWLCCLLS